MADHIQAVQSRSWNGTPIARRTSDGYVNATAMCKANGKEWKHYFETDRAHRYLDALSGSVGIPTDLLFRSITTGPNDGRGTWVHPQVAVDLARWISAPFAVWMDGWFLEEVENVRASQVREVQQLPPVNVLDAVERSIDLLERLGGVDDRAQLLLKDIVLNHAARCAGGSIAALPETKMLSLQEAFQQLAGATPQEATKLACKFGRSVKRAYKQENGRPPKTHKQLVNGRICDVCDYELDWLMQHQDEFKEAVEEMRVG